MIQKALEKVSGPDLPKTCFRAMKTDLWGAFLVRRLVWETPGAPGGVCKVIPRPSPDLKLLKSPRRPPESIEIVEADLWNYLFCRAGCWPLVRILD